MFSSDEKIGEIRELILDLKRYFSLQIKYLRLDFVSKLTLLLSALVLGAILFLFAAIVILFASFAAIFALSPHVGGMVPACGIVVLCYAVIALFVYWKRHALITAPLAAFLGRLFLENPNVNEEQK